MSRNVQKFLAYTFGVIALVVLLTHYKGFAQIASASAAGYRGIVGAFITPTHA